MAAEFHESITAPQSDIITLSINQSIDRLIHSLEQRRSQLLTDLKDKREEMRTNQNAHTQMEQQIEESRAYLEGQMTHNELHSMQERIVTDLKAKTAELQVTLPSPELTFICDIQGLEDHISRLGVVQFVGIPLIPPKLEIPNYARFRKPNVSVGKQGSGPGELNVPRGVAIEAESRQIFVADMDNCRIQIFSETGDYQNQFANEYLKWPHGILIHRDNIYITDRGHSAIFLFNLRDFKVIKRVGTKGSGNEEFDCPRQLAISPSQQLYVADQSNDRLQILTTDLYFQSTLRHQTMTSPLDVKFTSNEMFVLSHEDNPCIHVFNLFGVKSRSLITRGAIGLQVKGAFFFCLDKRNNIVTCDYFTGNIKVFSQRGELLHTIGVQANEPGMCSSPCGIAINNTVLVCMCNNNNNGLQIYS